MRRHAKAVLVAAPGGPDHIVVFIHCVGSIVHIVHSHDYGVLGFRMKDKRKKTNNEYLEKWLWYAKNV